MSDITPSFGDHVRIRATPLTNALGVAGLSGTVYGETTPSVTGVEVIGEITDDFALCVMIETRAEELWIAPDLVEFIDHAPGTKAVIGDKHFIRDEAGEWHDVTGDAPPLPRSFLS